MIQDNLKEKKIQSRAHRDSKYRILPSPLPFSLPKLLLSLSYRLHLPCLTTVFTVSLKPDAPPLFLRSPSSVSPAECWSDERLPLSVFYNSGGVSSDAFTVHQRLSLQFRNQETHGRTDPSTWHNEIILLDEEGTLWWHADSDWSRATVHGSIFVYPKSRTQYPYSMQPNAEVPIILVNTIIKRTYTQPCSTKVDCNAPTYNEGGIRLNIPSTHHKSGYERRDVLHGGEPQADGGWPRRRLRETIVTNYIMITPSQTMDVLLVAN
ncbi:LOW QUALITY PROTEIN: hypothetical protein V2J09_008988 [Rumex salicifolius]